MLEISSEILANLVVVVAHGKVTGEDYEKVLIPAIEEKLKTHKKIRLLYQLDKDFSGLTAEAIWDDAKLGFSHLMAFEVVAVVTDIFWIADAVKFFGFFLRCPVKVFKNDELTEARMWVASTPGWKSVSET
jgi:hypothetical protein